MGEHFITQFSIVLSEGLRLSMVWSNCTWGWKFKIPIIYMISLRNLWFNKYSKFCTQYCLRKNLLLILYLPCRVNNNLFGPKQSYRHAMSRSLCILLSLLCTAIIACFFSKTMGKIFNLDSFQNYVILSSINSNCLKVFFLRIT